MMAIVMLSDVEITEFDEHNYLIPRENRFLGQGAGQSKQQGTDSCCDTCLKYGGGIFCCCSALSRIFQFTSGT